MLTYQYTVIDSNKSTFSHLKAEFTFPPRITWPQLCWPSLILKDHGPLDWYPGLLNCNIHCKVKQLEIRKIIVLSTFIFTLFITLGSLCFIRHLDNRRHINSLLDIFLVTITVLYSISGAKHLAYTFRVTPTFITSFSTGAAGIDVTWTGVVLTFTEGLDKCVTLATYIRLRIYFWFKSCFNFPKSTENGFIYIFMDRILYYLSEIFHHLSQNNVCKKNKHREV